MMTLQGCVSGYWPGAIFKLFFQTRDQLANLVLGQQGRPLTLTHL